MSDESGAESDGYPMSRGVWGYLESSPQLMQRPYIYGVDFPRRLAKRDDDGIVACLCYSILLVCTNVCIEYCSATSQ